ncbi:MAG: WG repeat-containing protein [Lewinellaceae bacterium]|nr:WG repeat-containing protein [Lewinellaceae bacterium]
MFHDIVIFQKDNEKRKMYLLGVLDKESNLNNHNWVFSAIPVIVFFSYTLHLRINGTPKQNRIQREYEDMYGYQESRDTTYTKMRFGWTRISIERYSMKGGFYSDVCLEHEDGTILDKTYEEIRNFSKPHGLAAVKMGGYFGFIDTTGAEVIPCQFDEVGGFNAKGISYAIKSKESSKKNEWIFDTIYINTDGRKITY